MLPLHIYSSKMSYRFVFFKTYLPYSVLYDDNYHHWTFSKVNITTCGSNSLLDSVVSIFNSLKQRFVLYCLTKFYHYFQIVINNNIFINFAILKSIKRAPSFTPLTVVWVDNWVHLMVEFMPLVDFPISKSWLRYRFVR